MEVLPHAGKVAHDIDPERLQPRAGAAAGALQDGGGAERAGGDEHELVRAGDARGALFGGADEWVGEELDAGGAAVSVKKR